MSKNRKNTTIGGSTKIEDSAKNGPLPSETVDQQESLTGEQRKNSRRTLLKNTLIGGGAVISTSVVPDKWQKPLLNAVVLPAHAQTSGTAVVMGGGGGISITQADDGGFNADDILGVFIGEAHAGTAANQLSGGCLVVTVDGSAAMASMTLNTGAIDTATGTVSGTAVNITGLHSGYTVAGTLNNANAPTSCSGTVSGFGETGTFAVSSADPNCAPVLSTTAAPTTSTPTTVSPTTTMSPTTTPTPTTTPMPTTSPTPTTTSNPNSNMVFNFSLSKSYWS